MGNLNSLCCDEVGRKMPTEKEGKKARKEK